MPPCRQHNNQCHKPPRLGAPYSSLRLRDQWELPKPLARPFLNWPRAAPESRGRKAALYLQALARMSDKPRNVLKPGHILALFDVFDAFWTHFAQ